MALKFRRGTTAQKSGSLAFGEPYVNTDLNTLMIGGASGDITLSTSALTGSYAITGSNTFVGNQTISGSVLVSSTTSTLGQFVGNQNGYVEFSVRNTSTGISASGDIVVYADNGTPTTNYIDMGINNSGVTSSFSYAGAFIGDTLDGYMYNVGGDLWIGNASTGSKNIHIFNTGSAKPMITITQDALIFTGSLISNGSGVVSGSSQITLGSTTGYSTYSGSVYTSITGLETKNSTLASYTASLETKNSTLASYTASLETKNSSLATITGSLILSASLNAIETSNLELFSASQITKNTTLATYTGSNDTKWSTLGSLSGSFARTNSGNTFNGNQIVSGSLTVTQDLVVLGSSSVQNISSSNLVIGAAYITLNTFTPASRYAGINFLDSGSAGLSGSLLYDAVDDELVFVHKGNGTNITSSHLVMGPETYDNLGNETYLATNRIPKVTNYEHIGNSNISDTGTEISLNSLTSVTGSLKVTGGITGSLSGYATAVYTPGGTANQFLYQSAGGAGSTTTSTGNVTYDSGNTSLNVANLGIASTGTLASSLDRSNNISMHDGAVGKITIRNNNVDSITIFRGGSIVLSGSVTTTTGFTGSIASTNGVVSGSSQIVGSSITTNTITIGSTSTALGGTSTTLAGLTSVSSTGFTGALTGNASTATTLATARTINGTSFNGSADITIPNLVSGSSQITATSTTGFATGVKTQLDSNTVVSGSSQVAIASTTGFGTYINQALLTTSAVTHGNLTINGTITATGDITAYYTSDKRHKNNIQTISNAVLKVKQLNGVTWEWNDDVNEVTKTTPKTGLIAQEVQQVLPQVVTERNDGFLALDYSKMVGLLVEAIKEQQIQIDQLKAQIGSK
jgi:hypothetical protein